MTIVVPDLLVYWTIFASAFNFLMYLIYLHPAVPTFDIKKVGRSAFLSSEGLISARYVFRNKKFYFSWSRIAILEGNEKKKCPMRMKFEAPAETSIHNLQFLNTFKQIVLSDFWWDTPHTVR